MGIAATFAERPMTFGTLHLVLLASAVVFNILFYLLVRNRREDFLLNLLMGIGIAMIVAEIAKQWFCYIYMFDRELNLTYFPWQLCSIAMYLSAFATHLKGRLQEAALVYLSSFSLFGAIMALILPKNMLLEQMFFTFHSFAYHALIISEAIISIEILKRRRLASFKPAFCLFALTALVAEVINVLGKVLINDPAREPNMFYINPFYPTTQSILSDIARVLGTIPEIIIYLIGLTFISFLLFLLEKRLFLQRKKEPK